VITIFLLEGMYIPVIHVVCYPHVDLDLSFSLLLIRLELSFLQILVIYICWQSFKLFLFPSYVLLLGLFDVMKLSCSW
jgi:hypothetical protein